MDCGEPPWQKCGMVKMRLNRLDFSRQHYSSGRLGAQLGYCPRLTAPRSPPVKMFVHPRFQTPKELR
jgi:hypothetical protein